MSIFKRENSGLKTEYSINREEFVQEMKKYYGARRTCRTRYAVPRPHKK